MNWKVFLTACISLAFTALPQNMIGCGGEEDPYDYYTSFFNKDVAGVKGYQPFYYTSLLTFYDDWLYDQPVSYNGDEVVKEWIEYSKKNITPEEAADFIYKISLNDADRILGHITKNKSLQLPDSISRNGMSMFFLETKDSSALQYLVFAKKTEAFCSSSADWEAQPARDSLAINNSIATAEKEYKKNTGAFLKNKYGFQRCKLAFYNRRFTDCIKWYDELFAANNTTAVKTLALSYKAGSLFRLGKKAEAAYEFSKAFSLTATGKKKIFLGFLWATDNCNKELEEKYTALCKNNTEKATMLGMFSLYGTSSRLETMQKIYALFPASAILEILAIREINKLEEQYLTPQLAKEKGGKALYFTWQQTDEQPHGQDMLNKTGLFFEKLATDDKISNRGLYYAGAAYISLLQKKYPGARQLITDARKINPDQKISDQLQLINLLILVNEKTTLDPATESAILPALKWLAQKAAKDNTYKIFYRNLFSEIIAQRYQQQKDTYKAALAHGIADLDPFKKATANEDFLAGTGIEFVRDEMNTDQLLKLYDLMNDKNVSPYDSYLLANSSFKKAGVIDVLGTSFLRDFNFAKAIEWLKKSKKSASLETDNYNYTSDKSIHVNVNPFHDYINDWSRYEKSLSKPLTKLTLAQKLLELQQSIDTARTNDIKSKIYYQLATAFYNMSYYGNAWMAVAYNRSTVRWNEDNYSTNWEREYFGVYKAGEYYKLACQLSSVKEFKASAFFLMAKCTQRQVPMPAFNYKNYEKYEEELKSFQKKFMNNPLFAPFQKEFGDTKFFKYAGNRCSYLRDFVNKK